MSSLAVVLDASVAIALIRRELAAPAIAEVLHAAAREEGRLLVPDPFWLELVNVLVRRCGLPPTDVVEALREMDDLGIETARVGRPLILIAVDLGARFGLSAYDAAYLALAETEDARLLTLDRALADASDGRAMALPGMHLRRLSERAAPYGEPVDWSRFGPYLANLRAAERSAPTSQ